MSSSDKQVISEQPPSDMPALEEQSPKLKSPKEAAKAKQPRKQYRRRDYNKSSTDKVDKADKSDSAKGSEEGKRVPPRPDYLLVGKRPTSDYVYLLKKLMKENKH